MTVPFLSAKGLTRRYPGVLALDHADIDILPGEIIGLVGKNGAGKSTLIRILAGVETPDAGRIEIEGHPVALGTQYGPPEAHANGLAFMHQELANVPKFTVAENVALGSRFPKRLGLVDWPELHRRVQKALDLLDLSISPKDYVSDLTVVQQRMVMIARALYHDARLLVLDEPSTSLTESEINQLHRVIRNMSQQGRAVVYVSHRLREIVELTTKLIVMENGRVTATRKIEGMTERDIIDAIAGPAQVTKTKAVDAQARKTIGAPIMRVRDLCRDDVVRGASFDLHAGEVLGIAGLVGSGRTELARLLFGADRATGGTIEIGARTVPPKSPREAIAAGIALLPEDRRNQGLALQMSVRENITLASLPQHRLGALPVPNKASETATARKMVHELAIKTPHVEQQVKKLSGGNQQKVVLSRWLARDGSVFIFDEPTQGVDVHAKEEIFRLIQTCAQADRAAIVISSDFSELLATCDRIIVMQEGRLVGDLSQADMTEARIIELVYA